MSFCKQATEYIYGMEIYVGFESLIKKQVKIHKSVVCWDGLVVYCDHQTNNLYIDLALIQKSEKHPQGSYMII